MSRGKRALGADAVGVGNIERWEGAPIQMDPRQTMPECKSVTGSTPSSGGESPGPWTDPWSRGSGPRLVLEAYASRRYRGNLLNLFEPGFSPVFAPRIIDNERFPADWFERTSRCEGRCHRCNYCAQVLEWTLVSPEAL